MNAEGDTLDMDCNAVYLPYGDGASFAGFRAKPWSVPGTKEKLWFRGIKNLDATVEWALRHGLANATELVVTGVSAGGLSSFLHVDRIAERVRRVNPQVQVCRPPGFPNEFVVFGFAQAEESLMKVLMACRRSGVRLWSDSSWTTLTMRTTARRPTPQKCSTCTACRT